MIHIAMVLMLNPSQRNNIIIGTEALCSNLHMVNLLWYISRFLESKDMI